MLIAAVAARLAGWRDLQGRRRLLRAAVASTLAILLVQQLIWVGEWLRSPVRNQPQAVNATLRAHGMNDAARVLTNDPYLHDTDHPARTRYTQVYWAAPEAATLADLPLHPNNVGWQFIAVNRQNGLGAAGLRAHTDRPEALAELGRVGSIVLYCVRPCLSGSKPPGA
jgi:phosphopantetheinyl transferase (holo-ACP synthase)